MDIRIGYITLGRQSVWKAISSRQLLGLLPDARFHVDSVEQVDAYLVLLSGNGVSLVEYCLYRSL